MTKLPRSGMFASRFQSPGRLGGLGAQGMFGMPQMPASFNQSGMDGGVATRFSGMPFKPGANPMDPNGIVLMEGPRRNSGDIGLGGPAGFNPDGFPPQMPPQAAPSPKPFSVDMSDPYAAQRAAAEGREYQAPAAAPAFTPVPGGAQTPPPGQMQLGQQGWDFNRSFGGGNKGWTPVFNPNVWTWANMVKNQGGKPAPWVGQINESDFVNSLGQLSGIPFKGSMWDR